MPEATQQSHTNHTVIYIKHRKETEKTHKSSDHYAGCQTRRSTAKDTDAGNGRRRTATTRTARRWMDDILMCCDQDIKGVTRMQGISLRCVRSD